MKKIIILIGIILPVILCGCDAKIEGIVMDENGIPITNANVSIENMKFTTTTDINGKYVIDYIPGTVIIQFSHVCYYSDEVEIELLKKQKVPIKDVNLKRKSLEEFVSDGDVAQVAALLECGASPNETFFYDNALSMAAKYGYDEIVILLLEHGAAINKRNRSSLTPLFVAVDKRNTQVVKILLEKGADPNIARTDYVAPGATPLIQAAKKGNYEIVRILLNNGANLSPRSHGKTALEWARHFRRQNVINVILDYMN